MAQKERRFLTAFRMPDTDRPGLIEEDDGTVWLVNPNGSRTQLPGSGGVSTLIALTDVTGTADAGTAPVSDGAGNFPLTDVATQAELDAVTAAIPSSYYRLKAATAAGDTTCQLTPNPGNEVALGSGYLVIDPWSTNCEIRRVLSVAGDTVTLATAVSVTSTVISFTAATKRITRGTAENISKAFPGSTIKVTGSVSNDGTYTVADYPTDGSYDGTYITVNETLVDEAAGASVTIKVDLNRAHSLHAPVLWSAGPILATWYGAKASASTSDASNNRLGLQRMLDDSYWTQFRDLYLPGFLVGRYFINAPLYIESQTHLRGGNHKASVIAAVTGFASWNDDVAMLITRRNGLPCKLLNGGNDRYFLSSLGLDGVGVAYAKSSGYTSSITTGTGYAQIATNTFSVHATLITGNSGNHTGLIFRALATGVGGNSLRLAFVNDGANQSLSVTVAGNDITVHLATNGSSVVTSTAADVLAAVNADATANLLVEVSLSYGFSSVGVQNNGSAVVSAFALTTFLAGTAPFVAGDVGRSLYIGQRHGSGRTIATVVDSATVTFSGAAFPAIRAGLRWSCSPVNGFLGSFNQISRMQDIRIEECPGYGFAATGCQEYSVYDLMTIGCGRHIRCVGSQFGHFINNNHERTLDVYVSFEGTSTNFVNRSNHFIGGHIEDTQACDYFRNEVSGGGVFEGLYIYDYQATTNAGSTVIKLEGTVAASYGITGFQWSGPNAGPLLIDDTIRGYTVPMTAFANGGQFSVPHWSVGGSGEILTQRRVQSKTTAYTALITDKLVLASATGGAFSVTLPSAIGITGMEFIIKRTNSGANTVTIACNGAETIDGAATVALAAQYDRVRVISDGANWQRVD